MSRSVSAPSSVTNTSPCWNGLIVPGSTFRYGSNFWSRTRRPRAFRSRPSDAATIPLPSADTTPPVTKTYFGARVLTGFQGSSVSGRRSELFPGSEQRVQLVERPARKRAAHQPRALDREDGLRPLVVHRLELELRVEALGRKLERDAPHRHDVEHEERSGRLRPPEEPRLVRRHDLPARSGREAAAVGFDAGDARPPVGEVVRLGEERPDVLERGEQDAFSREPWQGTPGRRASARARPAAPRPRAARCACASGRRAPSRRRSAGRRAPRSGADA